MAKRKRKSVKRIRRRRIGAVSILNPANPLVSYGSIAAGFFLGGKLNETIVSKTGNIDPKIIGAGEVGLGVLLLQSKKKSTIKTVAGGFAVGMGAKLLLKEFGIGGIGGYQSVPAVAGYQNVPVVGKPQMAGYIPGSMPISGYTPGKVAVNAAMYDSSLMK